MKRNENNCPIQDFVQSFLYVDNGLIEQVLKVVKIITCLKVAYNNIILTTMCTQKQTGIIGQKAKLWNEIFTQCLTLNTDQVRNWFASFLCFCSYILSLITCLCSWRHHLCPMDTFSKLIDKAFKINGTFVLYVKIIFRVFSVYLLSNKIPFSMH